MLTYFALFKNGLCLNIYRDTSHLGDPTQCQLTAVCGLGDCLGIFWFAQNLC